MSIRHWIIAVAFGLVAEAVLAQNEANSPSPQPQTSQEQPADKAAEQPIPSQPPVAAPANESSAEHNDGGAPNADEDAWHWPDIWKGDGMAQWAMAATGVLAFFVSAWAVWLLKSTLKVTRDTLKEAGEATVAAREAVSVTKEIGQAQVRAYLFCKSASFERDGDEFTVTVRIGNAGQSPAQKVRLSGTLIVHHVGGMPERPRVLSWAKVEAHETYVQPIMSSGEATEWLWFSKDYLELDEFDKDGALAGATFDAGNQIMVDVVVTWHDVFDAGHRFNASLDANIGPSPYDPDCKVSTTGELDFRMDDPTKESEPQQN